MNMLTEYSLPYTGNEIQEKLSKIDNLAEKLANEYVQNPLYGKKVSFLGDSICAGADTDISYLGGYGKIIADRNNMVYENLAVGGATITAETYSDSTGKPITWLCRMVENMSADADYAIIEGGVNDGWEYVDGKITIGEITEGYNAELDDTTFCGAFESMLKQLITKFQGKKVGYIAIPKTNMWLYDSSRNVPNFYHIALECCAKWGVPVCDLNTITPPTACLGDEYMGDATHPTYNGYLKYYCDPIEAWMKTLTTSNSAMTAQKIVEAYTQGMNDAIAALQTGKLDNTGLSFKKALLPLADGTTIEIDVLTAVNGTVIIPYVNRIPISIDTDGSIYNVVGYENGLRLSSTGATKSLSNSCVTGYVTAKGGDVVRIFGCEWANDIHAQNYICAYDSTFTYIGGLATSAGTYTPFTYGTDIKGSFEYDNKGNVTLTLAALDNIAYIRVSSCGLDNTLETSFASAIVTVNEEIV